MKHPFVITFIFLIIYFVSVNFVANFLVENQTQNVVLSDGKSDVNLGFGDKVTISVKRPRFYGTIYETDKRSDLELLGIANLPIKVNGSNWIYFHFIILILMGVFIKIQLNKKKEKEWDSEDFGENISD